MARFRFELLSSHRLLRITKTTGLQHAGYTAKPEKHLRCSSCENLYLLACFQFFHSLLELHRLQSLEFRRQPARITKSGLSAPAPYNFYLVSSKSGSFVLKVRLLLAPTAAPHGPASP